MLQVKLCADCVNHPQRNLTTASTGRASSLRFVINGSCAPVKLGVRFQAFSYRQWGNSVCMLTSLIGSLRIRSLRALG